ncbi:YihY/virulence factor BrkB family protein [Aliiglaciecola litoralis]|uniref:YihY/virulence factor BrkB family protein n=1 Tax=Aliiglaciecola litoralis TaxID=582857 RepID=A0ABN1LET8_9ALTE
MQNTKQQHTATSPLDFTKRGYWNIAKRVYRKMEQDNLSLISAGVAFYFLLAIFPLIAALVSLYGFFVSADDLEKHMQHLVGIVPYESRYILEEQIAQVSSKSQTTLGIGFLVSILLAIWSGGKGSQALMTACNITYNETSSRPFWLKILMRLALTLCAIMILLIALGTITIMPMLIDSLAGVTLSEQQAKWLTWPVLIVLFQFSLAALYRYAPSRRKAKWRWVTSGSTLATLLWISATYGFSYYLSHFAKYNETYGSIGGVIILLMWFYLSAYIILFGAEFNSAMERQTHKDSTIGEDKPIGKRGAYVADNK